MHSRKFFISLFLALLVSGCSDSKAELLKKKKEDIFLKCIENRTENLREPDTVASSEGYTGPSDCLYHLD